MYGLDVKPRNGTMSDWRKIEITFKRIAAIFELNWKDLTKNIEHGGALEWRHKVREARELCVVVLNKYFRTDFLMELWSVSYERILLYNTHGNYQLGDPIIRAVVTSIHHDIKYNLKN